jgi:hypothetical protein
MGQILVPKSNTKHFVTGAESYQDLQQTYGAYNKFTELEIRTVRVVSRSYNQGTYGRGAGMARRPLTV